MEFLHLDLQQDRNKLPVVLVDDASTYLLLEAVI